MQGERLTAEERAVLDAAVEFEECHSAGKCWPALCDAVNAYVASIAPPDPFTAYLIWNDKWDRSTGAQWVMTSQPIRQDVDRDLYPHLTKWEVRVEFIRRTQP